MKAFPVIIIFVALSTLCHVNALLEPKYLTVLEGSKVVLKCDYEGGNPNQVLWVKRKLGVMSLDGSDFFTIARTLDPNLPNAYQLESDGTSSSLIMEDAAMGDLEREHPGLYKCVIDLFREIKFHVSIVKNDLACRWVDIARGKDEDTFLMGSFHYIECTITKDRQPNGLLQFSLIVGDEVVETVHVYGEDLWKQNTNVATPRFKLSPIEAYHGQSVQIALKLNTFGSGVGETLLKVTVAERLRLSYDIRIHCVPSQIYVKSAVKDVSPGLVSVPEVAVQRPPNALPHCLVYSSAPFQQERAVFWRVQGEELRESFSGTDNEFVGPFVSEDNMVEKGDDSHETVYLVNITKSLAESLLWGNSTFDASIRDLNRNVSATLTLETHFEPRLVCRDNAVFQLPSSDASASPFLFCSFVSQPPVKNVSMSADFTTVHLRPRWRISSRSPYIDQSNDFEDFGSRHYVSLSGPHFEIILPKSLTKADIRQFVSSFDDSFARSDGSGDWISWRGSPFVSLTQNQPEPEHGKMNAILESLEETNAGIESVSEETLNHEEQTNDVVDPTMEEAEDGADIGNGSAGFGSVGDGSAVVPSHSLSAIEDEVDFRRRRKRDVGKVAFRIKRIVADNKTIVPGNSTPNSDLKTNDVVAPESKEFKMIYDSIPSPAIFPGTDFTMLFKANAIFRVGNYERAVDFRLPSIRLHYRDALRCDGPVFPNSLKYKISCFSLSMPIVNLSSISIMSTSEEFASSIAGRIVRTMNGFDVNVEVDEDRFGYRRLREQRFDLIVRLDDSFGSQVKSVKIDFANLPLRPAASQDLDPEGNGAKQEGANKDGAAKEGKLRLPEIQRMADIGKVAEDGGDGRPPTMVANMMQKKWFLPVIGIVSGFTVLVVAIAIYAGVRKRAARPDRMERHRVG